MGASREIAGPRLPRWALRWLPPALVASSGAVLASWALLAVLHLGDRYQVLHRQGVWLALAQHAGTEGIYPEVFDGEHYGGVRYMPLPFLLHSWLARATGLLSGGKLLGLVATGALLALLYATVRRLGCPRAIALGLSATVVAGGAGLLGGTSIGGDVLPVVFQLGAVALVLRERSDLRMVGAGALSTLALLSRFNALWAPLAILVWRWRRGDRRGALVFLSSFAGLTAAALVVLHVASDGRMYDNVVRFAAGGVLSVGDAITAPLRFLDAVFEGAQAVWVLVPVVAFGVLASRRLPDPPVFLLGLLIATVLLLTVFADIGTGPNQLIDLVVLVALVAGQVIGEAREEAFGRAVLAPLIALALIWVTATAVVVHMREDLKVAGGVMLGRDTPYPPDPLEEVVPPGTSMLSEDPAIPALRGETPAVFDPFMLNRIARRDPELVEDLARRIEGGEFEALVLVEPLEGNDEWWRDYHFGTRLAEAMRSAYAWEGQVGRYRVYRPGSG